MTAARTVRATPVDLEIRGDGRTVAGLAVPFDRPAEIRDHAGHYHETFDPHAFDRTIRERGVEKVKFLVSHQHRNLPVGRATILRPERRGLYSEFRVSKTVAGDELLELVRDGAVDALSVGFKAVRDRWSPDRTIRRLLEVALHEVSAVSFGAYADAQIEAVRQATQPQLLAAQQRLHQLRRKPS